MMLQQTILWKAKDMTQDLVTRNNEGKVQQKNYVIKLKKNGFKLFEEHWHYSTTRQR